MRVFKLEAVKHQLFIAQKRKDPITGDLFKADDEIVFCAGCKTAFLYSSWEYIGKTHCGNDKTLNFFPSQRRKKIHISKEKSDVLHFQNSFLPIWKFTLSRLREEFSKLTFFCALTFVLIFVITLVCGSFTKDGLLLGVLFGIYFFPFFVIQLFKYAFLLLDYLYLFFKKNKATSWDIKIENRMISLSPRFNGDQAFHLNIDNLHEVFLDNDQNLILSTNKDKQYKVPLMLTAKKEMKLRSVLLFLIKGIHEENNFNYASI